jgi:ankyrin repeat protein/uncharacterized protein YwgA
MKQLILKIVTNLPVYVLILVSLSSLAGCATAPLGPSPLMLAVQRNDSTAIKDFLDKGADINAMDNKSWTALTWAAYSGQIETVNLLIDRGSKVYTDDLVIATEQGHVTVVKLLLDRVQSSVEGRNRALNAAVTAGNAELVGPLLDRGADMNNAYKDSQTILMAALQNGNAAVVNVLLEKGANVNAKETSGTTEGWTALSWAAYNGNPDFVKLLVAKGADVGAALTGLETYVDQWKNYNPDQTGTESIKRTNLGIELIGKITFAEWEPYKKANTREAYEEFLAKYPNSIYRAEAMTLLEHARAYQQVKALGTLDAYAEFLRAHPSTPNRREALATMSRIIKRQGGSYEEYKKFAVEYEEGIEFVPSEYRLAVIGPEGMRVHDILQLLNQGIEDKVIAAKIRMQNSIYKDFNFEEIGTLKKMGMTGTLIEAMLDSTSRAKREQEELRKKKEMEDLLAEIQRMHKKLDELKTAQDGQQTQSAPVAGQSTDPSLGDTLKNCAAQVAALEACKHLPWPANSVCAATAKSQFPCQ